jgi:hypothetical protein
MITLYFKELTHIDAIETLLKSILYDNIKVVQKNYKNKGLYSITLEGYFEWQLFTLGQAHQIIIINDNTRSTNTSI